jgi:pimeloyl-ACP methyl ester carboxylesterase
MKLAFERLLKTAIVWLAVALLTACGAAASRGEYTLRWSAPREIHTAALPSGFTLRYVEKGAGRPLVLMHTLRTQLDYFENVVPALTSEYHVYAIDLPGHGQSSIVRTDYTEPVFRKAVSELLVALDLHDVTLVGESIGGVLALTVAAEVPGRVSQAVSINPYDYGEKFGGGVRRGRASTIIGLFHTFGGVETRGLLRDVFESGFRDPTKLRDETVDEYFRTGQRDGYRAMEYSLFDHWQSWVEATRIYPKVSVAVTLVYTSDDWSNQTDQDATRRKIRMAHVLTIDDAGHFASLEKPGDVARIILEAGRRPSPTDPGASK